MGYKIENKKLVIDPEQADAVKYIFREYAAGKSFKAIAEELNKKGVKTQNNTQFKCKSFQHIVRNKVYTNGYETNGIKIDIPQIISESEFKAVQDILKKTKKAPRQGRGNVEYLLSGKCYCGLCEAPVTGESGKSKTGVIHNYYTCSRRKRHHDCKKLNEKKGYLEWYVTAQTQEYVLTPDRTKYIARRMIEEYEKDYNHAKIKELQRRKKQIEKEIDNIVNIMLETASKAARKSMENKIEQLEIQQEELSAEIARLTLVTAVKYTEEEILEWLNQFCKGDPLDVDYQRKIIDTFINSVYIYDDKIVIFYNVRGGKQINGIDIIENADLEALDPLDSVRLLECQAHQWRFKSLSLSGRLFYIPIIFI